MRSKWIPPLAHAARALPFLWGFAAAAAADCVVDVRLLFVPALAGVVAVGGLVLLARTRQARRGAR